MQVQQLQGQVAQLSSTVTNITSMETKLREVRTASVLALLYVLRPCWLCSYFLRSLSLVFV